MRVVCVFLSPGVGCAAEGGVSPTVQQLAECCLRFSPQVAVGEHWIFLEVGKCRQVYSEESVMARLKVMLQRFGVFGQLSIADDLPTALAFARFKSKNKSNLPVRALKDYLNPFRYSADLDKMLLQMDKLGIYTIEDFVSLPRKTLTTRFGREGLLAAQQLAETERIVWPHFKVQEKIEEKLILSAAPESVETLLFFIKTLTDRVASRLVGRGERVCRFLLSIHQEKFSHVAKPLREFNFELPLAQSAGLSLMSIIRERLNTQLTREPLQSEVELVEIKVLDTIPLKTSQKDLLNRDEDEREELASLVARLEEKLGKNSSFVAQAGFSYLPEKSWTRGVGDLTHGTTATVAGGVTSFDLHSPYPMRPLRILKEPLALEREGAKIWCEQKAWHIESMSGPERVREEWWNFGSERDYYRIQTKEGEKLWVFQRPHMTGLFLQGIYD